MTDGADGGEQTQAALLRAFYEARAGGDAELIEEAALARLLSDGVRTGWACRYDPDPARPVTWVLESTRSPQATV